MKCHLTKEDRAKFAMLVSMGETLYRCGKCGDCYLPEGHKGVCRRKCEADCFDKPGCCSRKAQGLVGRALDGWLMSKHSFCW